MCCGRRHFVCYLFIIAAFLFLLLLLLLLWSHLLLDLFLAEFPSSYLVIIKRVLFLFQSGLFEFLFLLDFRFEKWQWSWPVGRPRPIDAFVARLFV